MKKIIILIGIVMVLVVISGCCCNYYNRPNPYSIYVICDNQEIWDSRGKIGNFRCRCDNNDCNTFPVTRRCTAGFFIKESGELKYITEDIICTEVIGEDRRFK